MAKEDEIFEEAERSIHDLFGDDFDGQTNPDFEEEENDNQEADQDANKNDNREEKDKEKDEENDKKEEDKKLEEERREEEKKEEEKKKEKDKSRNNIAKSSKKILAVIGGAVVGVFSLLRQAVRAFLFGPTYAMRTESELGKKVDAIKDMEAKERANKEAEKDARGKDSQEKKKEAPEKDRQEKDGLDKKDPVMEKLKNPEEGMPSIDSDNISVDIPFEDEPQAEPEQEELPDNMEEDGGRNGNEGDNEQKEDEQGNNQLSDEQAEQNAGGKEEDNGNQEEKPESKEKNNGFVDKMTENDIKKLFQTTESKEAFGMFKETMGVDIKLSDDGKTMSLSKDGKTSRAISTAAFLKGDIRELSVACKDVGLEKKRYQYRDCDSKYIMMAASICAKFRKDNLEAGNFKRADGEVKNVRNRETLAYCNFEGDRGVYRLNISKSGDQYVSSVGRQKYGEEHAGEMVFNDRHFRTMLNDAIKRERQVSDSLLDSFVKEHKFPLQDKEQPEQKNEQSKDTVEKEKLPEDQKSDAIRMANRCKKAAEALREADGPGHIAEAMKEALGRSHYDTINELESLSEKISRLAERGGQEGLSQAEEKNLHNMMDRAAAQCNAAEYASVHVTSSVNDQVLQPGDISVLENIIERCGPEDAELYAKASALLEEPYGYMSAANQKQLLDVYREAENKGFIAREHDQQEKEEKEPEKENEEDIIDVDCRDINDDVEQEELPDFDDEESEEEEEKKEEEEDLSL